MKKRKEKTVSLWEARAEQYAANLAIRKEFAETLSDDEKEKYRMISSSIGCVTLNHWGCPQLSYDAEKYLIILAIQNKLEAWLLIPFYVSEEGWDEYVRLFQNLPPDDSYPATRLEAEMALETPKKKLSTPPVDK